MAILLIVCLIGSPSRVFGWSEAGHVIISLMAFDLLSPDEQTKIVAIMEKHPRFADDFVPPVGLPNETEQLRWRVGRIGYWPDIARRQPTYNRSTWHYELGPSLIIGDASKMQVHERPGPLPANANLDTQDLYISQAIELCQKTMADRNASAADRAIAMCWVAHLVADAHQPCHAGSLYAEGIFEKADGDRGANSIPTKQRKNMHALWDQLLGDRFNLAGTRRRMFELTSDEHIVEFAKYHASMNGGMDPHQWLAESREHAIADVYAPEVLDSLALVSRGLVQQPETLVLSEEYLKHAGRVAQKRAAQAALRLARSWQNAIAQLEPKRE